MDASPKLCFRQVEESDLTQCYEIETSSYPADEAASFKSLSYRLEHAGEYFRCVTLTKDNDKSTVIGFICSTRCHKFVEESMSTHVTDGSILAIHSVVIEEKHRRKGYALSMLQNYIQHVKNLNVKTKPLRSIMLIAKANLLPLYLKAGFAVNRPSPIVHGKDLWYEGELKLTPKVLDKTSKSESVAPFWVVDSFTNVYGGGNPAAVVLMPPGLTPPTTCDVNDKNIQVAVGSVSWMQLVAREFNLSETAFLWEKEESKNCVDVVKGQKINSAVARAKHYDIRYYTCSGAEVALCGHATLASAAVLFQNYSNTTSSEEDNEKNLSCQPRPIAFHTNQPTVVLEAFSYNDEVGEQSKTNHESCNNTTRVAMDLPAKRVCILYSSYGGGHPLATVTDRIPTSTDMTPQEAVESIFAMLHQSFSMQRKDVVLLGLDNAGEDLLVELYPKAFQSLPKTSDEIDFTPMKQCVTYSRCVCICCRSSNSSEESSEESRGRADFCSRFFGPKVGILEDPVTGSAHSLLAPYFGVCLGYEQSPESRCLKKQLVAEQKSPRGGLLECHLLGGGQDGEWAPPHSVRIIGSTMKATSGVLHIC